MIRGLLKRILPPVLTDAIRWVEARFGAHGKPDFEYVAEGWYVRDPNIIRSWWDVEGAAQMMARMFQAFERTLQGAGPVGMDDPGRPPTGQDYFLSGALMCFAYVLALAARSKERISILDWGGGAGHYYLISRALLPGVAVEYHCKDLPRICAEGRKLLPEARFYDDEDECFRRTYDLVLASGSLQCCENWKQTLAGLASTARPYLFVTRLPIVHRAATFVVVRRAYKYGYDKEHLFWTLNRTEFLAAASSLGLDLLREFLIQERPTVHRAPEQPDFRGFLFARGNAHG
jgi:putative methyltransferase (TIGR04325 family)